MNLLSEAYKELFPEKEELDFSVNYTGRFKGFNANIRMRNSEIAVNMSKNWKGVSVEIQKGLMQELLVRLFKVKKQSINMDLYNSFIKNLPRVARKDHTHPVLEESFTRVNESLFFGILERPNLRIGKGINRLGTYEYASDTVTISSILLEHPDLMDYVMYHELLHKKHQYTSKNGRHAHHSSAFRDDERKFPNSEILEKELQKLVKKHKGWSLW